MQAYLLENKLFTKWRVHMASYVIAILEISLHLVLRLNASDFKHGIIWSFE